MIRQFANVSKQILSHTRHHQAPFRAEKKLLHSDIQYSIPNGHVSIPDFSFRNNLSLDRIYNSFFLEPFLGKISLSTLGFRLVNCKKAKGKGRKNNICPKPKKATGAPECPECPCRCQTPIELSGPSRVRMDKSGKKDKYKEKEKMMKKCKDDECDFLDEE